LYPISKNNSGDNSDLTAEKQRDISSTVPLFLRSSEARSFSAILG